MATGSVHSQTQLPQSLLAKVANADFYTIARFPEKYDNQYSLELLDAVLSIFQKDPRPPSLTLVEQISRGPGGLECLERALLSSFIYPGLLETTRLRMRARTDDLAAWMEWSAQLGNSNPIAFERGLATVANSIVACLALKGTFMVEFLQHPAITRTLLTLWHSLHVSDSTLVTGVQPSGISSILAVAVGHEAGFHAIRDLHHPDKCSLFCKVATARIAQVPYFTSKTRTGFDVNFAQKRLFMGTWVVTMILFEDSVMRRGLCKAGYIYFSTMSLLELVPVFSPDYLLEAATWLFDQCIEGGSNPIRNVQKLLDYGYIGVLSEALILYDLDVHANVVDGQHTISSLEGYSYYPRVATSVGNAMKRVSPERSQALAKLPSVGKRWSHLLQVAHERGFELEVSDADTILCDSNKHHGRSLQGSSRSCSGNHLVVYCSKECQSDDWTSRHRDECS
ncbi:hypothetical protein BKA70DRAFT_1464567 [Coprinopsis sp. MPI-PUGE-AT-0042]|nr:hypothetical protein BKA70DRAFT_1464567 [Coprinopsis sp. MPI-PUGE-AT-0042]